MEKNYMKQEGNASKFFLMEPSNKNQIERMKKDIGSDGEDGGEIGEPQQQKCRNLKQPVKT